MFGGLFVVCHLSKHLSAVHSIVIVWPRNFRLLFKLPLKFRMNYNIPRVEAPLLVIKISKTTSSQRWRFYFALKRNETKHKVILHENIHATREWYPKELGTMSKNNLRRITLVRGPIWGIYSLTLIISCLKRIVFNNELNSTLHISLQKHCVDNFSYRKTVD